MNASSVFFDSLRALGPIQTNDVPDMLANQIMSTGLFDGDRTHLKATIALYSTIAATSDYAAFQRVLETGELPMGDRLNPSEVMLARAAGSCCGHTCEGTCTPSSNRCAEPAQLRRPTEPAVSSAREVRIGEHTLHILDGLIEEERVQRVDRFCRLMPFHRIRYGYREDHGAEMKHGHQWVHLVAPDERRFLPLDAIEAAARRVYGDDIRPGRAHVNCIQPNERRYPHIDGAPGRVIVGVYFVNAAWQHRWMGDLTFFDGDEPAAVVQPRPGRVALFDGGLVHRGGGPAADCPDVRYAVAAKYLRAA